MRLIISLFVVLCGMSAQACPSGYKEFYGECLEERSVPLTSRQQLEYFGEIVSEPGATADLFAPLTHLYEKADAHSAVLYAWDAPDADIEATVEIIERHGDFYFVVVTVYDGPTSCGTEANVKTTLKGYIPFTTEDGLPSLWKYTQMSGLC